MEPKLCAYDSCRLPFARKHDEGEHSYCQRRYCTLECRKKAYSQRKREYHARKKAGETYQRQTICVICTGDIPSTRSVTALTCSGTCSEKYHGKRIYREGGPIDPDETDTPLRRERTLRLLLKRLESGEARDFVQERLERLRAA